MLWLKVNTALLSRFCTITNKIGYRSYSKGQSVKMEDFKDFMMSCIEKCKPSLAGDKHKGQAGRVGIVGGSLEYTGAPYFAGISALKVGADLIHIFCPASAATVIKSYSPELIVHPLLDQQNAITNISPWLERLHVIVIGPGLGREPSTCTIVAELINLIKERKIPLVIDADGLFIITEKPELLDGFSSPVVLTPNKIEFERFYNKINGEDGVCKLDENILILRKGSKDEAIHKGLELRWKCDGGGSGRRCGGQGDLLSGTIAILLHWTLENRHEIAISTVADKSMVAATISCYAACRLIRRCNEMAFKQYGRSMLASDMIEKIHCAFEEMFGQ